MSPFVNSLRILNLCAVSKQYQERPSAIMGIEDPYTAYCLDEAVVLIMDHLEKKEKPNFPVEVENRQYSSFTDFYSQFNKKEV